METSLKPGFVQIFVLLPKKCEKKKNSVAQNLGGSSPPCSPARTPMRPRKFGNQVTVHRPSDRPTVRPSAPQAHQYKITQSTDIATQMQRKKIAWPPGLLEREKKKQQSRIFFDVIFDI